MKRRIIAILLLVVFFVGSAPAAYAHKKQQAHDADLKKVLFGSESIYLSGDKGLSFQAIANAAALTIDQFSSSKVSDRKPSGKLTHEKLLKNLDKLGIKAKVAKFDEIDLNTDNGSSITANTHRKYTHLGWNYKYQTPDEAFWPKRKQLLIDTVYWVLFNRDAILAEIPIRWDYKSDEQCEAFCAVVYYIHILGDHIEGDTSQKLEYIEPLQYTDVFRPGLITEIKEQLQILFMSQRGSWKYAGLMDAITTLEVESEEEYKTWGSLDTNEKCKINQEYANEVLDALSMYVPGLLMKEPFFASRFK